MRIYLKSSKYVLVPLSFALSLLCISSFSLMRYRQWMETRDQGRVQVKRNFSIAELMGSTNVVEVVKPYESTLLLQPSNPFSKGSSIQKRPFAVIVVTSQARFFNQRYTIRSTWYKWADELNIRIFFFVGFHNLKNRELYKILEEEHKLFDDLIIDNYEEGYYKLPGKILRMLKWYNATYSPETAPRFLVKTDQDVFLNLPNLVKALEATSYYQSMTSFSECMQYDNTSSCTIPDRVTLPFDPSDPETYYIGGRRFENAPVETDPDSKWYIDSSERERMSWSASFFPTYTNGPCYILSGNVVKTIYEASFTVPIYPFEDVYIVGMIASDRLNLYISNLPEMWLDKSNLCYLKNKNKLKKMVALHPVDHPLFMVKVCKRVKECRKHLHSSILGSSATSPNSTFSIVTGLVMLHLMKFHI